METDMDMGGLNLFTMEVVGVVILGVALLWVVLRTRSRGKETSNPRTEEATRELYEAEDKAAKNEDL
jgi:cytochrome c-type biogenesis protein CcmH/NrfF